MRFAYLLLGAASIALGAAARAAPPNEWEDEAARFIVQSPSHDGFVHIRLSPDVGSALPELKAQLDAMPNVRLGDPADYELTTMKDYPQALIAIDQHQEPEDWNQDFSGPPPYEFPRTVLLGNLLLQDYRKPLQELVTRTAAAKMLMSLGLRGNSSEIETCIGPPFELSRCHVGAYETSVGTGNSPDDRFFGDTIRFRSHAEKPRYVAAYVIDPTFVTRRLAFRQFGTIVRLAPGASLELELDLPPTGIDGGRFEVVTIWADTPFDPDALPQALQPPHFSASFAEYREPPIRAAGVGGGADALPGMAAFITQFYSTMVYNAADRKQDVDKVNERGATEASHRCGGSLIASNLVITAAHCVAKGKYVGTGLQRVLSERRVRADSYHLGMEGETYAIAGVAVPSEYDPGTDENDIALLLLQPDRGTTRMPSHTVTIGRKPPLAGAPLTVFGWGYTGEERLGDDIHLGLNGEVQRDPADLQYGKVAALDRAGCARLMAKAIGPGMICTAARRGSRHNVFTCVGDSGGPLVRVVGKREELVGIVSWSKGCGYKDYPDVYTDVTRYRAWIDAARQQLKPGGAIRVALPQVAASRGLTAKRN